MTAENRIAWIIAHRGEPIVDIYLCKESKKLDSEIVEDVLSHIWGGYYTMDDPEGFADSADNPKEVFANQICKQCYAMKRNRKIADNRQHYAKVCAKRGEIL